MESQNFFNFDTFVQNITSTAQFAKESVLQRYKNNICPNVQPGFLINSFDKLPPKQGITLKEIQQQIKQKMLPGILTWQSPNFFGYYPSLISDVAICADVFSLTFNSPSFNYSVSPTHTQLQNLVVDWSAEALNIPEKFKRKNVGGGVINTTASNSIFLVVHSAKHRKLQQQKISLDDPRSLKLVGYISQTAHISGLRALMLKDIHHRKLVPCYYDNQVKNYQVDLVKFREIIEEDVKNGLIPFFYGASLGTTWSGAVDQLQELAKICKEYGMWLNADAAYLGTTWICPQFRSTQKGLEHADSIVINFSKLGQIGMGGSLLFVGNRSHFQQSMNLNKQFSLYKQSEAQAHGIIDYRDWKVDLGKTPICFRFYYYYRYYGIQKIQQSYRWRNYLGQHLEKLVNESEIFDLFSKRLHGLVCFKLKGQNSSELTKQLASKISDLAEGYTTSSHFKNDFIIRISIGNPSTTIEQIDAWWNKVNEVAKLFLQQKSSQQ